MASSSTNSNSNNNNAMDVQFPSTAVTVKDPSSRLRQLKYSIGNRMAQERLITSSVATTTSTSSSRCCEQQQQQQQQRLPLQHHNTNTNPIHNNITITMPKKKSTALAYRRPRNLFHSASQGYYYSCTFLGDEDRVVLCVDHCGIDAIRLSSSSSSSNDDVSNNNKKKETLGRAIATGIHATSTTTSSTTSSLHLQQQQPLIKTTSIFGGQAFCTGLSSGEYRIFATEHASTWGSGNNSNNTNNLQPLKVSQRLPPPSCEENNNNNQTTTTTTPFIASAWSVPGPQRRYKPDSRATLARQLRNASCVLNRNMQEIYSWNSHGHIHHQHFQQSSPSSSSGDNGSFGGPVDFVCHWDFRETSTSTLLALHVGKYNDNVGLRVLDNRGSSNSNSCSNSKKNQVGIFVDMPEAMTVSACCFVTDNIIATAQHGASTPERIRLWDLRKMMTPPRSSSSKQQQLLVCPSFPREVVHALDPFQEPIHLLSQQQQEDDDHDYESSSLVCSSSSSAMRIVDLKSNNNGSLLVTTAQDFRNNTNSNNNNDMIRRTMQRHWAVDLARSGGGETIPVTLPYQVEQDNNNNQSSFLASSHFAHDERCSVVAVAYQAAAASPLNHHHHHHQNLNTSLGGGGGQTISLYDINGNAERIMSNNNAHNRQQQPAGLVQRNKAKKRNRQQQQDEQHLFLQPKPTGHIDAIIKDEYGLNGKLVSIAMNASGTAIVGVSRDSDLYCWTV